MDDVIPSKAPRDPAGHAPVRRPGSIRRTSSIDTVWQGDVTSLRTMTGLARDILTPVQGPAKIVTEGRVRITSNTKREVLSIENLMGQPDLSGLIGARAGGRLRAAIQELAPNEEKDATPLYLLLDDMAGASLVATWAWSRWTPNWAEHKERENKVQGRVVEGICAGFRPGGTSLNADGTPRQSIQSSMLVPPLPNPEDAEGWHVMTDPEGPSHRRARRMDVWVEKGLIRMDIGFQDTATTPAGDRAAVHEYRLYATASLEDYELLTVTVEPHILPYAECPAASPNATHMIGAKLPEFRSKVLEVLPGTLGCTHLNDVLRFMADVPQLVKEGGPDIVHD